jgi:Ca2+-binding EF-hand superfamily protein
MGMCESSVNTKGPCIKCHNSVNQEELDMLTLIFNDLASRSQPYGITRETFQLFFHVSVRYSAIQGLWAELIFNKFVGNAQNLLSSDKFLSGIRTLLPYEEKLERGCLREKTHALFEFYDIENKQGISFQSLIKMVQMR